MTAAGTQAKAAQKAYTVEHLQQHEGAGEAPQAHRGPERAGRGEGSGSCASSGEGRRPARGRQLRLAAKAAGAQARTEAREVPSGQASKPRRDALLGRARACAAPRGVDQGEGDSVRPPGVRRVRGDSAPQHRSHAPQTPWRGLRSGSEVRGPAGSGLTSGSVAERGLLRRASSPSGDSSWWVGCGGVGDLLGLSAHRTLALAADAHAAGQAVRAVGVGVGLADVGLGGLAHRCVAHSALRRLVLGGLGVLLLRGVALVRRARVGLLVLDRDGVPPAWSSDARRRPRGRPRVVAPGRAPLRGPARCGPPGGAVSARPLSASSLMPRRTRPPRPQTRTACVGHRSRA